MITVKVYPPGCAEVEPFIFIGSQEALEQVETALNYCFGHVDADSTECFYTVEQKETECPSTQKSPSLLLEKTATPS